MSDNTNTRAETLGELIAYCGVNCEACPDHQNNVCPSCRKTLWAEGDECLPVKCCREQKISCCGECGMCGENFPCSDMKEFYGESESHERALELMRSIRNSENRLLES